jgi:hypothetical protein
MSNFLIAFLVTIGASTWIYNKMYNRTGGITQRALAAAAISGVAIFIFMLLFLSVIGNIISG